MPKISLIIPVYNVAEYLRECLDSIINQTYKNLEIICVNDGSTDGSLNILEEYARQDSRIKVLNQANKGVSAARNLGLENAAGEYVMFFDGDDYYYTDNAIETAYTAISAENADICLFGSYNLLGGELYINYFYSKFKEAIPYVGANNYFAYPNLAHDKIIKTDFLRMYNIKFSENIKSAEDVLFSLDCWFKNPKYTLLSKCLYVYREDRPHSATNNGNACVINDFYAFKALFEKEEFRNQSEEFQLKIASKFLGAAIWYIDKFEGSWKLLRDSRKLLSFVERNYSEKELAALPHYKKLKKHPKTCLLRNIFSVRNSFDKKSKIITIMGMKLRLHQKSKSTKAKYHLSEAQSYFSEIFKYIGENYENMQIEPAFKDKSAKTLFFAFNDGYSKYFGTALQSLIDNSDKDSYYDIVVFSEDVTERNKQLLKMMVPNNFSLRFFNIHQFIPVKNFIIKNIKVGTYWDISTYYRLFIPLIMRNYKRVLYCDSDMIFDKSIDSLFEESFGYNLIMAVIDGVSPIIGIEIPRLKQMRDALHLKFPEGYFNAGLVMFNIQGVNPETYKRKILESLTLKGLWFHDQDILNIVFENNVKYLPIKYNFMWYLPICTPDDTKLYYGEQKRQYQEAYKSPVIIHYASDVKPWKSPDNIFADRFWYYARKTPFYEEIIYDNCNQVHYDDLKNINSNHKIFFNYYKSKLLSNLTLGKSKKHYINKKIKLKERVRYLRQLSKL